MPDEIKITEAHAKVALQSAFDRMVSAVANQEAITLHAGEAAVVVAVIQLYARDLALKKAT